MWSTITKTSFAEPLVFGSERKLTVWQCSRWSASLPFDAVSTNKSYKPLLVSADTQSPSSFSHGPPKPLQLEPQTRRGFISHLSSGLEQSRSIRHRSAVIHEHPLILDPDAFEISVEPCKPPTLWVCKPYVHTTVTVDSAEARLTHESGTKGNPYAGDPDEIQTKPPVLNQLPIERFTKT